MSFDLNSLVTQASDIGFALLENEYLETKDDTSDTVADTSSEPIASTSTTSVAGVTLSKPILYVTGGLVAVIVVALIARK